MVYDSYYDSHISDIKYCDGEMGNRLICILHEDCWLHGNEGGSKEHDFDCKREIYYGNIFFYMCGHSIYLLV